MKLKAYRVDNPGSWSTLCYAETAGQAKMLDFREFHGFDDGFEAVLAMRVVRVPQCDEFAPGVSGIDDDPVHQLMAGIMQPCIRCDREVIDCNDAVITPAGAVLCSACAVERTERAE